MNIRRSMIGWASAAGLLLGSTAAAAAPSTPRSASPVAKSEHLAGNSTFMILVGVVLATVVIAIVATHHNSNNPVSP